MVETDNGILSGGISPKETSAILSAVSVHTHNSLVTDNDLYDEALDNAKEDIELLSNKLGIANITIKILVTNTIQNEEVEVLN